VREPLGKITTTVYDLVDRVRSETDALGRVTSNAYDVLGRRTAAVEPWGTADARTVTTVFDLGDRPTAMVDPLGRRTTYTYDVLNRAVQTTDPLSRSTTAAYDLMGHLLETTAKKRFQDRMALPSQVEDRHGVATWLLTIPLRGFLHAFDPGCPQSIS
jgi:YD repeat-containing protein